MGFSTANANSILDLRFGSVAYTPPVTYYIGLSMTLPTDTGGSVSEPSGGSYARVAITNSTDWVAASLGSKSNAVPFVFPTATANWTSTLLLGWWVMYDSLSGGVFQDWGVITTPRAVANTDTFTLPAGDVIITLQSA